MPDELTPADAFSAEPPLPLPPRQLRRRDALKVGGLTFSASLLPGLSQLASAAEPPAAKAKSVIFLWMAGGVSHLDSFDPKPEAPEEIRGTLKDIPTNLPGVRFCETLPHLSTMADQLAIIRSYSHDSNDHLISQVYTLSGRRINASQLFSEPNIGSVISHLQGARNGLPGYIAVPGITRPGPPPHDLFVGGWLGNQYAPFCLGGRPDQPDFTRGHVVANPSPLAEENLQPKELRFLEGLSVDRLKQREHLRSILGSAEAKLESAGRSSALEGQFQSAFHLLTSPQVRTAFDLSSEPRALREQYGLTKLGGRCLMARRLVEAGARFVMVDYGYDPDYGNLWDNHNAAGQNFPHVSELSQRGYHLAGMDQAFAALLQDLKQRGLLEETLVVFLTEFGRTPKINNNGGRDHWGTAGSLFFAGAGINVGQVIGSTDEQAAYPTSLTYSPFDVAATIYHLLGIDHHHRLNDQFGRPHPVLEEGSPIQAVLS